MIDTPEGLADALHLLRDAPRAAVDTEADSLHAYREKLCLVQISTDRVHLIIDPLAELDLTPLLRILEPRRFIVHGADFDLRLLNRIAPFQPADVFDTVIAARLAGAAKVGLAALLEQHFDITLSKAPQKADWGMRPLPEKMLVYAQNDTRYLLPLADLLEERLDKLGRLAWFRQSCAKAAADALLTRTRNPDDAWRIRGHAKLSPRAQTVLRALWHWRDAQACRRDRPPFHILRNDQLLDLSRTAAETGTPPIPPHVRDRARRLLEECVRRALREPVVDPPARPEQPRGRRLTPPERERLDRLTSRRDRLAGQLGLDASVLAPRASLEGIARAPERAAALLLPWQIEMLEIDRTDEHPHPPAPPDRARDTA